MHLELKQPTSIGELRRVAAELRIPRVLAYVEFARSGSPFPGLTILGLGEMYAATAATQYSECRALVAVKLGSSELQSSPIDTWPSRKIHVYATAHVIRELASGRRLTSVTILDGGTAELWLADWISISLSTEAAVRFLSYPRIAQASVAGVYRASDLQRLRGYYERVEARVYEMPTSIQIPSDCGDVYVHDAQVERGRVSIRPE